MRWSCWKRQRRQRDAAAPLEAPPPSLSLPPPLPSQPAAPQPALGALNPALGGPNPALGALQARETVVAGGHNHPPSPPLLAPLAGEAEIAERDGHPGAALNPDTAAATTAVNPDGPEILNPDDMGWCSTSDLGGLSLEEGPGGVAAGPGRVAGGPGGTKEGNIGTGADAATSSAADLPALATAMDVGSTWMNDGVNDGEGWDDIGGGLSSPEEGGGIINEDVIMMGGGGGEDEPTEPKPIPPPF